jgi:hypothetical protein
MGKLKHEDIFSFCTHFNSRGILEQYIKQYICKSYLCCLGKTGSAGAALVQTLRES